MVFFLRFFLVQSQCLKLKSRMCILASRVNMQTYKFSLLEETVVVAGSCLNLILVCLFSDKKLCQMFVSKIYSRNDSHRLFFKHLTTIRFTPLTVTTF